MKFPAASLFRPLESRSRRERTTLAASAGFALLVLLFDQGTKLWVIFKLNEARPIIPGFLEFTRVLNPGAAWGMLSGHVWRLLLVALLAFASILYFFYYLAENYPERYFAQLLVMSGILGNSIDRLWSGKVVDFIHVHYRDIWNYPVFNVADIAICVGVGLFVISSFIRPDKKKTSSPPKDEDR